MYNTNTRKARSDALPQVDGAVDTPPTSADTSSQALVSTDTTETDNQTDMPSTATVKEAPPNDSSTDDEDGDDSETMSCLEYDHHLSTLQLSPDNLFDDAFILPQLDLDYRPGCRCDLNRVFRFDEVLPLQSTLRQQRKSSSSNDRSRKKEKRKKRDGKQKKSRKFKILFWKKDKNHRRDHRDDDDEPQSQQC